LLHLMPAELLRECQLGSHGLEWAAQGMPTTALVPGGARLILTAGGTEQGLSAADAQSYALYTARMRRFAAALVPMFSRVPPRLGTSGWADRLALLRIGWQLRRLGRRDMRELLRIGGMNVYDLLEENFESAALKGALAFDAVLGANFGPRSPGTVLTLLYRLAAESAAGASGLSQPKGGMGAPLGRRSAPAPPWPAFGCRGIARPASCSSRARASARGTSSPVPTPRPPFWACWGRDISIPASYVE
jgi:phytoene dehydrogenase-like protein